MLYLFAMDNDMMDLVLLLLLLSLRENLYGQLHSIVYCPSVVSMMCLLSALLLQKCSHRSFPDFTARFKEKQARTKNKEAL